jgi:hypothetical protein
MKANEVLKMSKKQTDELGKKYGKLQCELLNPLIKRLLNKFRKKQMPSHPELVMSTFRDSIIIADNRKRELWEGKKDINDEWYFQIIGKF